MEKKDLIVGGKIRRFSPYRILEHQLAMITFAILVITGLSQKFHEYSISQWIIINLGGVDSVRVIHRYTGLTFAVLTIFHIIVASAGVVFRKWPASMVINKKDFTDAIDNLKYYFGITDHPARCDRYDYKQKFEYWGVVIGGILMIVTGVVLWFPTFIVKYLPGEFIPAAKAAHTNEALLAFLVIITWHLYNSIFSPEVFPLDTSIFTGKISVGRMKHEHPLEYERITGESLDEDSAGESSIGKETGLSH
ncbi:MAG: cytochrome b/b6 domain-containing protein [Nitrospirota bacterium]